MTATVLTTAWVDERVGYDGAQLVAHWILAHTGIVGDALVAFRGACRVRDAEMADLADVGGPGIAGDDMLHFLMERFEDAPLECGVWRQRLFAVVVAEALAARGLATRRDGDDLFVGDGKLSISIATRSPVSTLLHFALNVVDTGTPVVTAALADHGIDPRQLADDVLARFAAEDAGVRDARAKVRAKGEWSTGDPGVGRGGTES